MKKYFIEEAAFNAKNQDSIIELYNLDKDPKEKRNIAALKYDTVVRLKNIALNYYRWVQGQLGHKS